MHLCVRECVREDDLKKATYAETEDSSEKFRDNLYIFHNLQDIS